MLSGELDYFQLYQLLPVNIQAKKWLSIQQSCWSFKIMFLFLLFFYISVS